MPDFRPIGPCPAKIMIVGEALSVADEQSGIPFSGGAGKELGRMLADAKILQSACFTTNLLRVRAPGGDPSVFVARRKADITNDHLLLRDKFVLPIVKDHLELLKREIELCQPNVIIALGNLAMWALTGEWGVHSWRGSQLQCDLPLVLSYRPKVIPTYHPTAVLRQWEWRQIMVHDLKRAKRESEKRELIRPEYEFIIRPDFETALTVLSQLYAQVQSRKGKLAVDLETRAGHISDIGLAWSKTQAICIPVMSRERPEGYWTAEQEAVLMHALWQILTHPNCEVVGQNFSYDAQYFRRDLHFTPNLARDTMIAQHTLFSNLPKNLAFLSSLYCDFHTYWKDELDDDPSIPEEQRWNYNCKDCVITFEVDEAQQAAIAASGLAEVNSFQQRLFWPVLRTMNRGLRVDTARRANFAIELQDQIAVHESWLAEALGESLNIRSPKQMMELFYVSLGQRAVISRKTNRPSCDDEALRKIAESEPLLLPITQRIAALRSLSVFLSTFVRAPLDVDGRMRCSFNIAGTDTYRFASSKNAFGSGLNLQNIPSGGEESGVILPNVRSLFIPDPGMTFFDMDLSSADLRIVVWEADEPEFKAMLREGKDPYTEIAKEFYHDPSIKKSDPRRHSFKSFAHGTNYLGTAKGLAERLGLLVHEAESTQKWYFEKFPRIRKWQKDLIDQVTRRRMIENIFGYRFHFLGRIEGTVFNEAAAWIPQSSIACLINRIYVNLDSNAPDIEILLQVHDSLAGQFPTYLRTQTLSRINELSQITLPYDDPLIIPIGVKTSEESWGGCK